MKIITLFLAACVLIPQASANTYDTDHPKKHHWYRDWKNWAILGASAGASLAATREGQVCRSHIDLERCSGRYGPFGGQESVRFGVSLGMGITSVYMREHDYKAKWWLLPASGAIAFDTTVAVKQATKKESRIEDMLVKGKP